MATSKQRREAERRRLRRQAQRRQQLASRRRRTTVIISVIGVLVVVGLVVGLLAATHGSDPKPASRTTSAGPTTSTAPTSATASTSAAPTSPAPTSSTATTSASTSSTPTTSASTTASAAAATIACRYPAAGKASRTVKAPPATAPATGTATLHLTTSQGDVTLTLDRTAAPCAVNSVVSLARQGFYDNTSCHRLVNKSIFVLQCGDPTGTGTGGPGYSFADELGRSPLFARGSVVMANGGPNTNGSQFFLVDRTTRLGAYTPLGTISSGLAVVDKVYRAGTSDGSSDGPPRLRFTFRGVTVS